MEEKINELLNSNPDVREAAAGNPQTPADILSRLAEDSNRDVREAVARNPRSLDSESDRPAGEQPDKTV